jgi:aminotransferase EvaB
MAVPFNDLRRAYVEQETDIAAAVADVMDSGWYVMGPQHDRFEQGFADHLGVSEAVAVASGTDALTLILTALAQRDADLTEQGAPDRVLCSANAGGYTAIAAARTGLRCEFIDVDPSSHCLDPPALARALDCDARGVVAVVVTHLYGRMADVAALLDVCTAAGVALVEDCAQSTGARLNGRAAGSFGVASAFSFYPTKNLGALGDGGAIASADHDLLARIRQLRQYGWDAKYHQAVPGGMNSRLDELQAAVLNIRLPMLDAWNRRRRDIIAAYSAACAGTDLEVLTAVDESHAGHLAVLVTARRDELRQHLVKRGIGHDIHYPVPDHRQPAHRADEVGPEVSLDVTERLANQVLSLPCFPQLQDDEIDKVCDALTSF